MANCLIIRLKHFFKVKPRYIATIWLVNFWLYKEFWWYSTKRNSMAVNERRKISISWHLNIVNIGYVFVFDLFCFSVFDILVKINVVSVHNYLKDLVHSIIAISIFISYDFPRLYHKRLKTKLFHHFIAVAHVSLCPEWSWIFHI